jgi:hypothetical protein
MSFANVMKFGPLCPTLTCLPCLTFETPQKVIIIKDVWEYVVDDENRIPRFLLYTAKDMYSTLELQGQSTDKDTLEQ